MNQKGFSLVELLVVVAIIGVLASVGVVGYDRYVENTKRKVLDQNYEKILRMMETEATIVRNNLGSAVDEYNVNGTATGNKISGDTTCHQFLVSMKRFLNKDNEAFKNPYRTDKTSITVDNAGWTTHQPGMISFFCYKSSGGYGSGGGCPMIQARFRVIVYYDPKSKNDNVNPKYSHKSIGMFINDVASAQADCGWNQTDHGNWHTGADAIDTDAAYTPRKLIRYKFRLMQKGFSLVELLVVVAIIGVLAGVGVVGYDRYVENAKMKVFEQNVQTILKAVDFEYTVISNDLSSAMNEIAPDGTATGNKISSSSTCAHFVFSVKEHFKDMQNPWFPNKKMITVDSEYRGQHKKGMVQIMCNRSTPSGNGFRKGWNCPVESSNFQVYAHYRDGTTYASEGYTETGDSSEFVARSNEDNSIIGISYNRGLTNLTRAGYTSSQIWDNNGATGFANGPFMQPAAGETLCGTTNGGIAWEIGSNYMISTDADY